VGYNFVVDIRGSIFFLLDVVAFQNREITENSDESGPYSSSRSPKSKVIDLGVNQKPRHDRLPINSNCYRFEILTFKARKWIVFPPLVLTPPLGGTHYNYWMKLTPQKLERWGYRMVKNS